MIRPRHFHGTIHELRHQEELAWAQRTAQLQAEQRAIFYGVGYTPERDFAKLRDGYRRGYAQALRDREEREGLREQVRREMRTRRGRRT